MSKLGKGDMRNLLNEMRVPEVTDAKLAERLNEMGIMFKRNATLYGTKDYPWNEKSVSNVAYTLGCKKKRKSPKRKLNATTAKPTIAADIFMMIASSDDLSPKAKIEMIKAAAL
jgi:hypothetical protein